MKVAHQLIHVLFPALFALASLFISLRSRPFSGDLLATHMVWGFFFYGAPHFLWAGISAALRPTVRVWHLGFVVSSGALLLVGALSAWGPRDPSGLPYQWLVYWPLAGLLIAFVLVGWFLAGRPHAST